MIISCVSQKGGVGKSSIARTIAVEFTRANWNVLLADIDSSQSTSKNWNEKRRNDAKIKPVVNCQNFSVTYKALNLASDFDLIVLDGAPHSTKGTLEAALQSELVILPTGTSIDDLETQIKLAAELIDSGVSINNIRFAVYASGSVSQAAEAIDTVRESGFDVFDDVIDFKLGYIKAFDEGFCATETRYKSLNAKAASLIQSINEKINNG